MGVAYIGIGLAAGLGVLGAGLGIGMIAEKAAEGVARQPEAYNSLFTIMIVPAAMVEGLGFFACIIALMGLFALNKALPTPAGAAPAEQHQAVGR